MNRKKINKVVNIATCAAIGLTLGATLGYAIRTHKDVLLVMAVQNEIAKKVLFPDEP